jgi:peptide/nickel transport system substrate-binding protein
MQAQDVSTLPIAVAANQATTKTEIRIGSSQEPDDLTFANNALVTSRFRSLIEDGLVDRDDNENVYPQDAWFVPTLENGGARFVGIGEDQYLSVKYKIRRGIKWSDGKELTSNDAVFAYKLYMNPDSPVVSRSEYERLQNVDNPDKYTVIFNFKSAKQAKAFMAGLTAGDKANYPHIDIFAKNNKPVISITYSEIGSIILPEHVLGKIPPAKIPESDVSRAPIGTGPYKVDKWTTGQEMVLSVNPNYTLTAAPPIKKITAKFITDVNQMLAQIQTGDIDYITSEAFVVPPANAADLQAKGISVVNRPAATWEHIDFYFEYGPFKEKAVREAIITGINRGGLVRTFFGDIAPNLRVLNSLVMYPSDANYRPHFSRYAYNVAKARQLLTSNGCRAGGDGIMVCGGVKAEIVHTTTGTNRRRVLAAQIYKDNLKAIGIEVNIRLVDPNVLFGDGPQSNSAGNWDMAEYAWVTSPDSSFTVSWLGCRKPSNNMTYCNQRVTRLLNQSDVTLNAKKRAAIFNQANQLMAVDVPVIPLYAVPVIYVHKSSLKGTGAPNPTSIGPTWNVHAWKF